MMTKEWARSEARHWHNEMDREGGANAITTQIHSFNPMENDVSE